jgi:hypothetical protein
VSLVTDEPDTQQRSEHARNRGTSCLQKFAAILAELDHNYAFDSQLSLNLLGEQSETIKSQPCHTLYGCLMSPVNSLCLISHFVQMCESDKAQVYHIAHVSQTRLPLPEYRLWLASSPLSDLEVR